MKIEEFNVKIVRENGIFVATLIFKNNEKEVTQSNNIQGLYNRIAEVLCLRLDDDTV